MLQPCNFEKQYHLWATENLTGSKISSNPDGVLPKGNTSEFFHDEFGCPVYVKDVVAVILALSKRWISDSKQTKVLLNFGGPDRVSRLQMAETVADVRRYSPSLIKSVSASSVRRPCTICFCYVSIVE
ncbi:unnamed protein product [Malus baccata var. baccata]